MKKKKTGQNLFRTQLSILLWLALFLAPRSTFSLPTPQTHWNEMSPIYEKDLTQARYQNKEILFYPESKIDWINKLLSDPEDRINSQFEIPDYLFNSVRFWLSIYTEYSTRQFAIFDRLHHDIVYEVVDLRALADRSKNLIQYEVQRDRILRNRIKAYRTAFRRLEKSKKRRLNPKTQEEKNILQAISKIPKHHRHSFSHLRRNLKIQTGQRDNIIKGLLVADSFFPEIEKIFKKVGVPIELTRLSLVESSFNHLATSRAGAKGVWQFMEKSGKEYLLVDKKLKIDERLSPLKSSVAASRLLRRNYKILGNWPLAAIAYHSGLRRLVRFSRKNRSSKNWESQPNLAPLFNPCRRKSTLGFAGRSYLASFLAVLYAERYRDYFYGNVKSNHQKNFVALKLNSQQTLSTLSRHTNIPLKTLEELNPDILKRDSKLPIGFWTILPREARFGPYAPNLPEDQIHQNQSIQWVNSIKAKIRYQDSRS